MRVDPPLKPGPTAPDHAPKRLRRASLGLLLALLCLGGCDETGAYLVLHANLLIPDQLDAVCLQLAAGGEVQFSRRYPLTVAQAGRPQTLSVVPGDSPYPGFELLLRGERRGWTTAWLRSTVPFEDHTVSRHDVYIDACPGAASGGAFEAPRRLTNQPGSRVATLPVAGAADLAVVLSAGAGERFAAREGVVYRLPGGLPGVPSGGVNRALALDLDADCDLDLLLLHGAGVTAWLGDGAGGFSEAKGLLPLAGAVQAGAAADLDGDTALDLVLAGAGGVTLFFGSATQPGTYRKVDGGLPGSGLDAVQGVAVGFVNDDAQVDIVLARGGGSARENLVLLGERGSGGDGVRFSKGPALSARADTRAVALADLDGDGLHEAIFANAGSASRVYPNQRGTLGQAAVWSVPNSKGQTVQGLLAADLDNDCDVDLLLARRAGVRLFRNNGRGTLSEASLGSAPPGATDLCAADLSGDGKLDLVLAGDQGGAQWLRQR